jgi:hypothetical protein
LEKPTQTGKFCLAAAAGLALSLLLTVPAVARVAGPKYYFQVHDVESRVPLDGEIRKFVGEAVKAELASRPEWASELGDVHDRDSVIAELKKRKLSGFDVVVKVAAVSEETKDPNPGSRMKRLSVSVKLAVLGTTLPGEKMMFSGDGEASAEAEVPDRRMEAEADAMLKDAIKDALKQAVDQAVLKLGAPASVPLNESKRKRKKG